MSRIGETILIVAVVVATIVLVSTQVECGKIPLLGSYCVIK